MRRIDAQLDRLYLLAGGGASRSRAQSISLADVDDASATNDSGVSDAPALDSAEVQALVPVQQILQSLSAPAAATSPLLSRSRLQTLLKNAAREPGLRDRKAAAGSSRYQHDLAWLLVGKAAAQVCGQVLDTYLEQVAPLAAEMEYWDDVLTSNANGGIYYYYLQTAPLRVWAQWRAVARDLQGTVSSRTWRAPSAWTARWGQYWNVIRESVRRYNLETVQAQVMSPLHQCRLQARRKQKQLQRIRELSACGLGVLENEALQFEIDDAASTGSVAASDEEAGEWKSIIMKSVLLMQNTLRYTSGPGRTENLADNVFAEMEDDFKTQAANDLPPPAALAETLIAIADTDLPNYIQFVHRAVRENGRPSAVIRYWIPATATVLASGACLSTLLRRKADIIGWLRDFGVTVRDFWLNWVVDPIRKTLGTIRHDKDSEIALMSKESLEGDRASLERMVVDFSLDHPDVPGHRFNDSEIAQLRAKVKEGDLTPVLMAYEKDLRRPFVGTIRGDLIRALLIQIQKTKVDVEVALRGIDNLLKSQELVFAFVGLTPGVLVSIGLFRWLSTVAGSRGSRSQGSSKMRMVRLLR